MDDSKNEMQIEQLALFNAKSDYLLNHPYGFEYSEIYLQDFIDYVFTRDSNEQPFEETASPEYLKWRKKKTEWVHRLNEWKKEHPGEESSAFPSKIDYQDMPFFKYNPIALDFYKLNDGQKRRKHYIITKDETQWLDYLEGRDFVIASPITYVGRNRSASNARYLYAFAFDLDGVGMNELSTVIYQSQVNPKNTDSMGNARRVIPEPNIIVNSGHGLHLYYLLKHPVPLYEQNLEKLNRMKKGLTDAIWGADTSTLTEKQYQGVLQGFRLPGTKTKFGEVIRAFYNEDSEYHTLEELNEYISPYNKANITDKKFVPMKLAEDELEQIRSTSALYLNGLNGCK